MNVAVIGMQFGDEGKGKIVDFLAERFDVVARFSGGSNAGHTIVRDGEKFKFHIIPSGVLRGKIGVLGNGMVINPRKLMDEIKILNEHSIKANILISSRAHVVTRFHEEIDAVQDKELGIGTTRQGIGPCYQAKYQRSGLRIGDLFNLNFAVSRLRKQLSLAGLNVEHRAIEREISELRNMLLSLKKNIVDTEIWLNHAMDSGKNVLFEGSQGSFLDIDFGTYPFVTSTNTTVGGIIAGLGIAPRRIHKVIGVAKAYMTRVGSGPFPTELFGEDANFLRERGGEYGATTGRPRRVGNPDFVLLKYASLINGVDEIALTKVDVLSGVLDLQVATTYNCNGETYDFPPPNIEDCVPKYESMNGWTDIDDENLNLFIKKIEDFTGARVKYISYGPEPEKTEVL